SAYVEAISSRTTSSSPLFAQTHRRSLASKTTPSAPLMLSAQMSTDVAVPPVPSGRRKTVSFPVLATYSAPPCSARPLAPKGGKPVVASWVFLATLVTHPLPPPEQPPAGIRKISHWNESETRRSPELSNTRALGAAVLFGKGNGKPGTMVQQGSVA